MTMNKKAPRASKLARDYGLNASEEQQIKEAFSLFSEEMSFSTTSTDMPTSTTTAAGTMNKNNPLSKSQEVKKTRKKRSSPNPQNNNSNEYLDDNSSEMMVAMKDLRSILIALSLSLPQKDSPEHEDYLDLIQSRQKLGWIDYETFLAICALLMKDEKSKKKIRPSNHSDHQRELDEAWSLFIQQTPSQNQHHNLKTSNTSNFSHNNRSKAICRVRARTLHKNTHNSDDNESNSDESEDQEDGSQDRISIDTLRAVAKILGEDVTDDLLSDMILEANHGAGITSGVGKDDFDMVMRRAGVWR